MALLILDTNVLEYSMGDRSYPSTKKAREILLSIEKGINEGIIPPQVLMELYYRISENSNVTTAQTLLKSILATPNLEVQPLTEEMGLFAGEMYYKYNICKKNYYNSIGKSPPGAVDCLIAGMGKYVRKSIICTNDDGIIGMTEINAKKFYLIQT